MRADEPLLWARKLSCFRGDRLLFEDLDLRVDAGAAVQVCGPNGSGKSTFLRVLAGLLAPTSGTVVGGNETPGAQAQPRPGEIDYVGHANGIKLDLTPTENLDTAARLTARPRQVSIATALSRFGLEGFEDRTCQTLSAGQRRRVALARLLVTPGRTWLLDEPFTAMDQVGVRVLNDSITGQLRNHGAVVFSGHAPIEVPGAEVSRVFL